MFLYQAIADDIYYQSVRSQISEAQKIAGGSGSEQDIAEAKIELEVVPPEKCFSWLLR